MDINYWAVLVASIASMVIGSIWYGPLFGKKYMSLMGMDSWSEEKKAEMKKGMTWSYVGQFLASFVMFLIFACLLKIVPVFFNTSDVPAIANLAPLYVGAVGGVITALWVWLGFVVPLAFGDALWGGKMSLFWLSIGNMLVTLLVAGAIIGAWSY
jgi:hypothetical protein